MQKVNHITYNTEDNTIFSSEDIDKSILFKMKRYVDESREDKFAELFDEVSFKLTQQGNEYVATLYYLGVPFLITCGSKYGSDYLWKLVTDIAKKFLPNTPTMMQPQAPYVIDLLIPMQVPLRIYKWTGDFTKCLFWYLLMDYKEKGILNE